MPKPSTLYTYVKNSMLLTWSIGTIKIDNSIRFEATNGHLRVVFNHDEGSTAFLQLFITEFKQQEKSVFDGYIRGQSDFDLILQLTEEQNPNW